MFVIGQLSVVSGRSPGAGRARARCPGAGVR